MDAPLQYIKTTKSKTTWWYFGNRTHYFIYIALVSDGQEKKGNFSSSRSVKMTFVDFHGVWENQANYLRDGCHARPLWVKKSYLTAAYCKPSLYRAVIIDKQYLIELLESYRFSNCRNASLKALESKKFENFVEHWGEDT